MYNFIITIILSFLIFAGVFLSILLAGLGDYLGAGLILFIPVSGLVLLYLESNNDR